MSHVIEPPPHTGCTADSPSPPRSCTLLNPPLALVCSLCGARFGLLKQQQQQQQQQQKQKTRLQQPKQPKQGAGSKRPVSAGEKNANALCEMGFDNRVVRQALEKVQMTTMMMKVVAIVVA